MIDTNRLNKKGFRNDVALPDDLVQGNGEVETRRLLCIGSTEKAHDENGVIYEHVIDDVFGGVVHFVGLDGRSFTLLLKMYRQQETNDFFAVDQTYEVSAQIQFTEWKDGMSHPGEAASVEQWLWDGEIDRLQVFHQDNWGRHQRGHTAATSWQRKSCGHHLGFD
ncbi:hypothetical protein DL95DRAFT_467669 [Leptodontidium sp. 2 PMI_412]|nr:hypothetical protein DL95DRAFT_467669 [Leptodontidium sp. 2 PMI_412]